MIFVVASLINIGKSDIIRGSFFIFRLAINFYKSILWILKNGNVSYVV